MKKPVVEFRACLTLVFLAAASLSLFAQGGDQVSLRFLTFPKILERQPIEMVVGENETITVEPPSNELSKTYRVPRRASWVFGETTVNDDGESSFTVFGKAAALSSSEQLIILVRKGKTFADGVDVVPIDGRMGRFGGGDFFFMNAAKVDIACEAAGEKFAIRPGRHHIFDPKASGRTAHFTFYFRKAEEVRPFWSSRWPVADYARAMIFFYHDPNNQRLRLHSIRDFIDADS